MTEEPLNGNAEDLGALLGLSAATRLMAALGTELVYIPETAPEGHRLENILGRSAYLRLCREYGTETLRIPSNAEAERIGLIRAVASMIKLGRRIPDIATTIDMSARQVMRYRVEAERLGFLDMVIKERKDVV